MTKVDIRRLDSVTTNDTTATTLINDNFSALQEAIENTLSRDGSTPNFMDANLDLNSHKIINAGAPTDNTDLITKEYFDQNVGDASASAAAAAESAQQAQIYANSAGNYALTATSAANTAQAARDFIESDPNFITVSTDLAAGDNSEIHKVNANKTNIDTVADSITNVNAVADDLINIDNVADDLTNIDTVADNITNVNAVADNESNINAVAGNATNINAVNANKTNINAVAGNNTNITAVANNATNINAVNANKTNIDAIAGNNSNITAVANNEANINAVNANKTNIDAVVANATNINTVAGDITNINAVAADLTNIDNASAYAAEAKQWAIGDPSEPVGNSSKYWAEYAESIAEGIGDPANRDLSNLTATGQAVLDSKLDTAQITNCITEIPQDIKLELNDGTLTLKAGSKVYVPNGSGVFDVYILTTDFESGDISGIDRDYSFFVNPSKTGMAGGGVTGCYSGASAPSSPSTGCFWYDTTNNSVKRWSGSAWVDGFSLPFCIITSGASSIKQVFNGFGYIGSTVFALPGVKGLIPNGRNADGTLKNKSYSSDSVKVRTVSGTKTITICLGGGIGLVEYYKYDESENMQYSGATAFTDGLNCGQCTVSSGTITSLTPKTAFHAVDYNDFSDLKDQVSTNTTNIALKANDADVVKLTGNQTITGEKTIQNAHLKSKNTTADGTASSIATSQEYGLYIQDKNNARIGNFFGGQLANGNIRTYMCACRPVNGTTVYKYAEIQQYPDGTAVFSVASCDRAVAPTPATSDDSTKIATTAYVKAQGYQTAANLVTSVSSSSTDSQYPSAKLLYDTLGDIETLLAAV